MSGMTWLTRMTRVATRMTRVATRMTCVTRMTELTRISSIRGV